MNAKSYVTDAARLAPLMCIPVLYEPRIDAVEKGAKDGVFIGCTRFLPYFLDFDVLMNPHVFVCGITGSGKTYLMKNLMLKLYAIMDSLVIVVDFTGEYKGFVDLVGERSVLPSHVAAVVEGRSKGIVHVDLSGIAGETNKVRIADDLLVDIVENMRSKHNLNGRRIFIMLDEAWKLLRKSKSLETMLREGRKYRHGLIFSSQLIEDVDLALLSNSATIFAFRLQNSQSLESLARNYNLQDCEIGRIQNLNTGSCAVLQTNASNRRGLFFIERVAGAEVERFFKIIASGSMEMEVQKRKLEEEIKTLCGSERASKILRNAEEAGYVELGGLIGELIISGADRRRILASLRNLGLRDNDLADAFALAISHLADENGKEN
jgi:Helicase HerA, central domain